MNAKQKLGSRVAEEAQLLAEEKWIIEALGKIKTQRNCLQIERLQLESMKNKLRSSNKSVKDISRSETNYNPNTAECPPCTDNENYIMTQASQSVLSSPSTAKHHLLEAETMCNNVELDLKVTNSIFSKFPEEDFAMELDEEEEEDDENCEDLLIDMNMFMNGTQNS